MSLRVRFFCGHAGRVALATGAPARLRAEVVGRAGRRPCPRCGLSRGLHRDGYVRRAGRVT